MKYASAAAFRTALEVRLKKRSDDTGESLSRLRKSVVFDRAEGCPGLGRSQLHTAGSQFPSELPNRGGENGVVVGQSEIAGQRPVATQRPKLADAQCRTVRHSI
jgi:hypothetical protein